MHESSQGGTVNEIILASSSEWRATMLRSAGFRVRCIPSPADENVFQSSDPVEQALGRAELKAAAVFALEPEAMVLGADQVVWDGVDVFGKPLDAADHLARLQAMRGRTHTLVTGYCVLGPDFLDRGTAETRLTMRADLSDEELAAYVASGEGSRCAGGYAIEGQGAWLFERVHGDWNNIIGLPLFDVISSLRRAGWRYGASA